MFRLSPNGYTHCSCTLILQLIISNTIFHVNNNQVSSGKKQAAPHGFTDGNKMTVEPRESAVVLRIVQEFAEGQAESNIMKRLNLECVQGRFRSKGGWSPATVQDS
jgi:hypothetical protein